MTPHSNAPNHPDICHGSATPISMILSSASLQISRFSGFIIIIACPNLRFLPCLSLSLSLYLFMCVIARLIIVLQLLLLSNSAWRTIVMWAQMWNCMNGSRFSSLKLAFCCKCAPIGVIKHLLILLYLCSRAFVSAIVVCVLHDALEWIVYYPSFECAYG